jgi:hypothetical protein
MNLNMHKTIPQFFCQSENMQYQPVNQGQVPEKVPWGLWAARFVGLAIMCTIALLMTENVIRQTDTTYECYYPDFILANETSCYRNDTFGIVWVPATQLIKIRDDIQKISTIFWILPMFYIVFTSREEIAFRRISFTVFLMINGIFIHLGFNIFLYIDLLMIWLWFCYSPFMCDTNFLRRHVHNVPA